MKGITYFKFNAFSINEGGMPVNIHMSWKQVTSGLYIYLRAWRIQFYLIGFKPKLNWKN